MHCYTSAEKLIQEAQNQDLVLKGQQFSLRHQKPALEGISFEGFQQYTYAESAKNIAWNIFAKTNQLYVKTYEARELSSIVLLCDNNQSLNFQSGSVSKFDIRNLLLSLICISYLNRGKKVRCIFFNKKNGFTVYHLRDIKDVYMFLQKVLETPFHTSSLEKKHHAAWSQLSLPYHQTFIWLTDLSHLDDFHLSFFKFKQKYLFDIRDQEEESLQRERLLRSRYLSIPFPKFLSSRYQKKYAEWKSLQLQKCKDHYFKRISFYTHSPIMNTYLRFFKYEYL